MQRHTIAGHGHGGELFLTASEEGLLTDGMGSGGHNVSKTGQDRASVQAAPGQVTQLDLRALWLSKPNNVRIGIDCDAEDGVLLQGTVLPPVGGGGEGRRFRSKPGGKVEVLLVTDALDSLSFFSLAVSATCVDASGCDGHGSCDIGTGA